MSEHLKILEGLRDDARIRLQHAEAGRCKLYATGPGGASIDATSEYLSTLRQQLEKFDTVIGALEELP